MDHRTLIHSARIVSGGASHPDAWVQFDGNTIRARGSGDGWVALAAAAEVIDASGRTLTPGFIDLHGHGAGGFAYDEGPEAAESAIEVHRAHGTTRSVLSLVTARLDDVIARVRALAPLVVSDPLVMGLHLEGPFLADSYRGAHDPELLRAPDAASVRALLDAANGTLFQVTLAPELPGAEAAVRRFVEEGVRVAIGHTAADFDEATRAFGWGATLLTHAFNGMAGMHHRAPGPALAAMRCRQATLEVIADAVHVHPEMIALLFREAPHRVALITDAMAATGAPDGDYQLGPLQVAVRGGVARTAAGGLAGSTLTQDRALRVAVQEAGVSLTEAVTALTETPASCLGRAHDLGRLDPGYRADAVLLSSDLRVESVWAEGRRLF
ncbi:MAG TPA: N-acetylglucosamine-6-phosphate deacetylase [Propionicimonas sp.]